MDNPITKGVKKNILEPLKFIAVKTNPVNNKITKPVLEPVVKMTKIIKKIQDSIINFNFLEIFSN